MGDAIRTVIRSSSFVRKELVEIVRQPRLVLTLVLGPFLILLAFGAGLRDEDPPVRTVIVTGSDPQVVEVAERYRETQRRRLDIDEITSDRQRALERLRAGELDVVVSFPDDATETIRSGEQAVVTLFHNFVDPIEIKAIELSAEQAANRINEEVSRGLVARGQRVAGDVTDRLASTRRSLTALEAALGAGDPEAAELELTRLQRDVGALALGLGATDAVVENITGDGDGGDGRPGAQAAVLGTVAGLTARVDALSRGEVTAAPAAALAAIESDLNALAAGLEEFGGLPPEVIVSPFQGEARRITEGRANLSAFYAPAALVLLVQHMIVTFISLSLVREEELGTTELFRVAPLRGGELLVGKSLAYLLLGGLVTALLTALLIIGLGVPMRGSWVVLGLSTVGVLLAAIALGFVIALVARTDSQAVQYAMLVLLASIFFSGFILGLDRFVAPLDRLAYLLPTTYGIALFRGTMLRGEPGAPVIVAGLIVLIALLGGASWVLLRRRLGSQ